MRPWPSSFEILPRDGIQLGDASVVGRAWLKIEDPLRTHPPWYLEGTLKIHDLGDLQLFQCGAVVDPRAATELESH